MSKRLQAAADLVTAGSRLADIGTDHAWLPIYLCEQGVIPSAIAMDLREGPLKGAERHIREAGLAEVIVTRLSDGLEQLSVGEADTVVITGMGGNTICRILAEAEDKLAFFSSWILGPQSEPEIVRAYLEQQAFEIIRECLVIEEGKYYPLLKAVPSDTGIRHLTPAERFYGPCLLRQKDPVLHTWLCRRQDTLRRIRQSLALAEEPQAVRRQQSLDKEEKLLQAALQYYEM